MGKRTAIFHGFLFAFISAVCYGSSFTKSGSRDLARAALKPDLFPAEANNEFWSHYTRNTAVVLLLMSILNFSTLWSSK